MVNTKKQWLYGESWEKFPINDDEVWQAGKNFVAVKDISKIDNLDFFGQSVFDMSYIDPPWNTGNINSFYTKAGLKERKDFAEFLRCLLHLVKHYSPNVNYMEMGNQNVDFAGKEIKNLGGVVTNIWDITYYRTKPCKLIRYSFVSDMPNHFDFTGIDDDYTPRFAMQTEPNINNVLDLCTGRGLTGRTAFDLGISFYGTELNKRRLACLLDFYNQNNISIKILKG